MNFRSIGKTGIQVSELAFGTMSFSAGADEKMSMKMFDKAREAGINFFDCANKYAEGEAEKILGKCISNCRNEVLISSKVYNQMGNDVNSKGLSRHHIMSEVENSLRRLNTDRIDFYFLHKFDENTRMEDTLRTLDDLQKQGKIVYPAVSNWAAWQIALALGVQAKEYLARFEIIQPMYSLVKRQVEVEILPLASSENIAVMPYSPLGAGLLTGKYNQGKKPEIGRIIEQESYSKRYADTINYNIAEKFTGFAYDNGFDPVPLAIAWVKSEPTVTSPLIGARNVDQLDTALKSLEINMTEDLRQAISDLSTPPPHPTDRDDER
ncbi:aldo/keto reductase [Alkalicoccus saliphilus]|uniref:Aldo/keto reductase n=1 Tax=Alkalicoccus saliphilus TaxID=200989 RepID=A0A2T4U4U8_9BACI|nr:aldo/keto reductase [Alkalicoccus saliphilus]PTL38375.1 aldo/keto reductase [Alkalicoccus saliphilus]